MSKTEICQIFGCSMEQLNRQYAANAATLNKMRIKAVKTGKKVNGYTLSQLTEKTAQYQKLSA